ncbi:MAG: DUF1801 domain-containing protein [Thermoplasmata archaeon]|nr:DUF1801 domain-containing protein [Thermoplasmata archaeon]MCI4354547.1 DUF1801 domain-containing protein [Thermoplasmata archaeon]
MVAKSPPDPRVEQTLDELPEEVRAVARALRDLVRSEAPELRETLKWGNPVYVGRHDAVNLMLFPHHANLGFFRGADLAKQFPEIEGTGKNLRHVKVPDIASTRRPVLRRILRAAVALDAKSP